MKLMRGMICLVVLALAMAGCGYGGNPLRIEPIALKGAIIEPVFQQAWYRIDRDQNVYFYLKAANTKTASGATNSRNATSDQTVVIRVFWQPVGGRTSLNAAALNTTFRYVVTNATGAGSYEGAGFIRFYSKVGGKRLKVRLIDSDLRLTEATANFVDTIKRSRFRGTFTATRDDSRTLGLMLDAQRDFFAKTFAASKGEWPPAPATAPTTRPATAPATAPAASH